MEVKAGYKRSDVGVIPEDWRAISLAAITTQIGDGLHGTPIYSPNGDYFFINGNNLNAGKIVITPETQKVDRLEFAKHQKPLSNRSILMSINGTIGNLGLFDDEPVVLGKSAAYLNVKLEVSKHFVYHSLQTQGVRQQFLDGLTGSTIGNLGLTAIRRAQIPLPPTEVEQLAIAKALSDVDALLATLDQVIAKKRDLKQAAMQQLLTGKTRLPGFSGEWEVYTVSELEKIKLVSLSRGQVISKKDIDDTQGVFPIYSSSIHSEGLFGRYGKFMFDEELITWSVDGGGNFFYRPKHKFSVTNVCGFMRVDTARIDYRYFAAQLQLLHMSKRFDYQSKAHPSVIRKEYEVWLPPLAEQTAIATILSDMDAELSALETRRVKTRALKQAMMQELLTGKTRLV